MTLRSAWPLAVVCAGFCVVARGAAIYEVPELPNNLVGAWDVNILADDVHFETASVISKIRIRLAIAGVQTCKLWLFDALGSPPIHTATFTNVPASTNTDASTYDFDMHVQVPKDVYVGFSAQGDGWTANAVDYWSRGTVVNRGVAGTAGQYYYGPVAGGQITTIFNSGDSSFGCLQILSEPVRVTGMTVVTGQVSLAIASLPVYATNAVERNESIGGTQWVEMAELPLGLSNHTWSATNGSMNTSFYRIKTR